MTGRDPSKDKPKGAYVYALFDPRDGEPFYVGKGTGDRAWAHWRQHRAAPGFDLKSAKLDDMPPTGPTVVILADGLSDFAALVLEADMLQLLVGTLTNIQHSNQIAYASRWAGRHLARFPTMDQYLAAVPWGKPDWYHAVRADLTALANWGQQ